MKFIVIGGGAAGLMATLRIAELKQNVELFSLVPVKRSHTACAQGGINGAANTLKTPFLAATFWLASRRSRRCAMQRRA